jgi:nickel-dependent lactate racemase
LRTHRYPRKVLEDICAPGPIRQDQWQAQLQALVQLKADVYIHSDGLKEEQIRDAMLNPCKQIETTVTELVKRSGSHTRIYVLPEGLQTIPRIAG